MLTLLMLLVLMMLMMLILVDVDLFSFRADRVLCGVVRAGKDNARRSLECLRSKPASEIVCFSVVSHACRVFSLFSCLPFGSR